MILTPHLILAAAIAAKVSNPFLAVSLAFLSHYLLDFIPHIEYSIDNIRKKQWSKTPLDFAKIGLDFSFGILLILLFSENRPVAYVCAFFAIISDGFSVLNILAENIFLKKYSGFHQGKLHFLKYKKIPLFWRILSQILVVLISIVILTS